MAKLDFIYDDILAEEDFLTEAAFKEYVGKVKAGLKKAAKDAGPNLKKGAKRAAIGAAMLGAAAGGITGYGAVHGIKQAKAEKAAQERQAEDIKKANEEKANAVAQKFHKAGVDFKDTAKEGATKAIPAAKEGVAKAKAYGAEKAAEGKAFAGAYKELKFAAKSLDAAINADVKAGPDIVANFNAECNQIKEKYGEEAYNQAKKALETEGKLSNSARAAINKAKSKLVKEEVNYFPY